MQTKKIFNGYTVAKLAAGVVLVALSVRAADETTPAAGTAAAPVVTAPVTPGTDAKTTPKDAGVTAPKDTTAKKQVEDLTPPERRYTVHREPIRQLGRGIANVATGVGEIPLNIYYVNKSDGDVAALTYGLVRGVWRFLVRETVGVFEIITFPVGWAAIIEPEFLFEPMTDPDWHTNHLHFAGE
jgi:putative exosortase-associated protein (TIGR04073 family)